MLPFRIHWVLTFRRLIIRKDGDISGHFQHTDLSPFAVILDSKIFSVRFSASKSSGGNYRIYSSRLSAKYIPMRLSSSGRS